MRDWTLSLIVLVVWVGAALAQSRGGRSEKPADTQPVPTTQKASDKLSVTEHELKIGGSALKYKATAGYMSAKNEEGKERANFFFVAYEKSREEGAELGHRPVTFVFNGGPGSAAVWLHLGTAGPKRVLLTDEGEVPPPPFRLVDNEYSWLDATDLVFIDPIGTGYSRPAQGEKGEAFFGVREDVESVADFIRMYITRYERWLSPKFLAGESYGTTRAAGLSQFLMDRYGIALNGIVLISSVLNFGTIMTGEGNDLPYPLFLPSYTAVAWYHRKLPPDLQSDLEKSLKEVEQFAAGEYTEALAKGSALAPDQRKVVAQKLARYSGLPLAFIEKADLRIDPSQFRKQLLDDGRQIIGRYDARLAAFDPRPTASTPDFDASYPQYHSAYAATFNDYVRRGLKYENDIPYEVLTDRVRPWNYGRGNSGYLNVADELRSALVQNPHLKVMFCSGYFDLATPYFGTDYTVNHLDLSKTLRANVSQTYFMGGHMVYHPRRALEKLKGDVKKFVEESVPKEVAETKGGGTNSEARNANP
jgi:carboxypeptidase C (cathepsin A)